MVYILDDEDAAAPDEPTAAQKASRAPEKSRVCLRCGHWNPVPEKDAPACLCEGCGAQLPPRKPDVQKGSKAEEIAVFVAMARSSDSTVARRGNAALVRVVGPIRDADLVINSDSDRSM